MKKGVGRSKPPVAKPKPSKLAVVKNTTSKPKRRSHRIAPKLEFSNTQDDPTKIEEAEEEGAVQRERIDFIEDESKNKDSSTTFEGGHSSNDLLEFEEGHFSASQGSIYQTPSALLLLVPLVNTLPFLYFLFLLFIFINFQVSYLYRSQVSTWFALHLKKGVVPSLDLSFMDQVTPHVELPSRPPIKSDVAVAHSTISHLLSLDLLFLSTVQKNAFHVAMAVLQSTSLEPKARAFISRVINRAPKVFSSIEHVVKENA